MTRSGLLPLVAVLSLSACSGHPSSAACAKTPAADCADLLFRGQSYNELQPIRAPAPEKMQELGDANYPACNDPCPAGDLGGLGATDVWLIDGVEGRDAVVGIREDSSAYVVFVRVGVDPATLPIPEEISAP